MSEIKRIEATKPALNKGVDLAATAAKVASLTPRVKATTPEGIADALAAPPAAKGVEPAVQTPAPGPAATPPDAAPPASEAVQAEGQLALDPLLLNILTAKRSHQSEGDTAFRMWLMAILKGLGHQPRITVPGNMIVTVGTKATTLWSCHIDTMQSPGTSDIERQRLMFDPNKNHLFLQEGKQGSVLGADNGAAVYMFLKMIEAKKPGTYVFHVGEERGGIGSRAMREDPKEKDFLEGFDRAIAFDRKGTSEVIHTQGGTACASPDAYNWACANLNLQGMHYVPSDRGSFTDTKNYIGHISECFNIAVGYENEHGPKELLDVAHLYKLLAAVLKVDWENMPAVRKPIPAYAATKPTKAPKADSYGGSRYNPDSYRYGEEGYGGYGGYGTRDMYNDELWDKPGAGSKPAKSAKPASHPMPQVPEPRLIDVVASYNYEEMQHLCEDTPGEAATLILMLMAKLKGKQAEIDFFEQALGA